MSRLGTAFLTIYDTKDGDSPTYVRYYSNYPGLLSEMGDPDDSPPNTTVGWTSFTTTAPSTAYWIAEKRTVGETVYGWILTAVQSKTGGLPFVKYEMLSTTAPTDPFGTGLSTWENHAIEAVEEFTGRNYTDPKEFGYGTTIVIDYANNATVTGTYKRDETNGTDEWEAPSQFIDGSLVVDGSIVAAKIAANSIDANKIVVTGSAAIETAAAAATRATGTLADAATDAASKVAVVTDNIYTTNETTIDGGAITSGTISADHIVASSITSNEIAAESISADKMILDGALEFTDNSSGIHFGKGSLFDGSSGAFFGRSLASDGVTEIVGLSISSSTSQMTMASNGDLNISGAKIFSGAPGTPTEISTSGTHNLPVGTTSLDLVITGGGGGGPTNAAGDRPTNTRISGSDGGDTVVKFYSGANGTGTLINTYTATGGSGGAYSVISNVIDRVGTAGEASLAPSSIGGSAGNIPSSSSGKSTGIGDGTRGGGGGSGGANGTNGSADAASNNGGSAGQTLSFTYDASSASSYVVTIGSGGAGGVPAQLTSYIASGGDGGVGYVAVTNSIAGGTLIDFDDFFILPSNSDMVGLSSISSNSHNSYHSAPQGAGWYWVSGLVGYGSSYWSQQGLVPWGVDIYDSGGSLKIYHYSNSWSTLYYKKIS